MTDLEALVAEVHSYAQRLDEIQAQLCAAGHGDAGAAAVACRDHLDCLEELLRDARPAPAFVCPRCQRASYNPHDGRYRYCGNCCAFTGDLITVDAQDAAVMAARGAVEGVHYRIRPGD